MRMRTAFLVLLALMIGLSVGTNACGRTFLEKLCCCFSSCCGFGDQTDTVQHSLNKSELLVRNLTEDQESSAEDFEDQESVEDTSVGSAEDFFAQIGSLEFLVLEPLDANIEGRTLLHAAIMAGDLKQMDEVFSSLNCRGILMELVRKDFYGKSPLIYAKARGLTLLHILVLSNNAKAVEVLQEIFLCDNSFGHMRWMTSLQAKDGLGRTPLHYATLRGNAQLLANLIKNLDTEELSLIFSIVDQRGRSPIENAQCCRWNMLHLAAAYPDPAVVHWICPTYPREDVAKGLLVVDINGKVPLDIAADLNYFDVRRYLLWAQHQLAQGEAW